MIIMATRFEVAGSCTDQGSGLIFGKQRWLSCCVCGEMSGVRIAVQNEARYSDVSADKHCEDQNICECFSKCGPRTAASPRISLYWSATYQ